MEAAILWLALWLVFAFVGTWLIYAIFILGGVGAAAATEKVWIAPIVIVVGWLTAIGWFIFAAVQVALQIASVVGLATAG